MKYADIAHAFQNFGTCQELVCGAKLFVVCLYFYVFTYELQSALVIRTTFVPLCFSERNVLIASGTYECSYSQRNYLVFWKSVLMADVLIARVSYDVLITKVLITRVDCTK